MYTTYRYLTLNNQIGASVGTVKNPELPLNYYQLARVLTTKADEPNSFPYSRVIAKGVYFESDEAKKMAEELGPLPAHARMFRKWVQDKTATKRKTTVSNPSFHPLLTNV